MHGGLSPIVDDTQRTTVTEPPNDT